jgi:hypothetical protein
MTPWGDSPTKIVATTTISSLDLSTSKVLLDNSLMSTVRYHSQLKTTVTGTLEFGGSVYEGYYGAMVGIAF